MGNKQPDNSPQSSLKRLWNKITKGDKPRVAVLRLEGIIGGMGFKKGLSLESLNEDIEKAFKVNSLKAVAIQINSPGGSPVQSELIYQRIRQLSEKNNIPVYTFAEDAAASGGYWLACAGDEIYSSGSSVVGSIGVISSGFGFVEAIKKMGVERRVYTQGENKSVLDSFQEEDPKSIEILNSVMKDLHDSFKDIVRERRAGKIDLSKEKQLFSGEFWSGKQGKELGLVDDIGDMHSVITEKYGDKIKFEKISPAKSWLKRKLGASSSAITEAALSTVENRSLWARLGL